MPFKNKGSDVDFLPPDDALLVSVETGSKNTARKGRGLSSWPEGHGAGSSGLGAEKNERANSSGGQGAFFVMGLK